MRKALLFFLLVSLASASSSSASAAPPAVAARPTAPNPPMVTWNQWVSLFKEYMDLIATFGRVVEDSTNAGVAAVIYTDDIMRTRPSREAIDYYQKLLPEVKDPAVRRAIQLRLAEHYRIGNQPEEALAQLRQLITAAPATQPAAGR